jgi:beta-galactosidase
LFHFGWRVVDPKKSTDTRFNTIPGIELEPGKSIDFTLPQDVKPYSVVEFSITLAATTKWAEKGHEVAWAQFEIGKYQPLNLNDNVTKITETTSGFILTSGIQTISVDKATGNMVSYKKGGKELLAKPLVTNLYRSPTNNDLGGGTRGYAHFWRLNGLKDITYGAIDVAKNDESVTVTRTLKGSGPRGANIKEKIVYSATKRGLFISQDLVLDTMVLSYPRIGMLVGLDSGYSVAKWYGRGPYESYWDRKLGAKIGHHVATMAELHTNYMDPQENGNRADVYSLELVNRQNKTIRIEGEDGKPFNFGYHSYDSKQLDDATYPYQLRHNAYNTLTLDWQQMGLGGDDSWSPRVHKEYQIGPGAYHFGFWLLP